MWKQTQDEASSKNNNLMIKSKENNKLSKHSEIKPHIKRDRHALENINQNARDIKFKAPENTDKYLSVPVKKPESSPTFHVKYLRNQQILIFKSPYGRRSLQTQVISPIVDEQACGPRQSLRHLPATKPPKLQRRNSSARRTRIIDGTNFGSITSDCTQYRMNFLQNLDERNWMYIIDRSFLQAFDPIMKIRNHAITWLIETNQMFQERTCVLLNGVRIFDLVLASVLVPRNLYILVASTAFWISAKFDNTYHTSINQFLQNNDTYSKEQYFRLEIKILQLLNYNVNMVDPTLYVDYIFMSLERKKPNMENITLLYHSAYFFLELFAMDCMYTSTKPIIMAIAAVRTSMKLLPMYRSSVHILDNLTLKFIADTCESTFASHLRFLQQRMVQLLSMSCERSHLFHNLFQKYYTSDYCHVTEHLRRNINHREIVL